MIKQQLKVRGLNSDFPFAGDDTKIWKCRIVDSNLGISGDPKVEFIRSGRVYMTFQANHLSKDLDVIFYEDGEQLESERLEIVSSITKELPPVVITALGKIMSVSKWLASGALVLLLASILLATVNHYVDLGWFLTKYEKLNAANGAKVITQAVEDVKVSINETIWDAPGIKEIEKEKGVNYKSLFMKASDNLFVMGNPLRDKDGNALLMNHDEAEDICDEYGGSLLTDAQLSELLKRTIKFGIYAWSGTPEWTSDSRGFLSDDYVIHIKGGEVPDGGTNRRGIIYGDEDEVKIAARCAFMRSTFQE